MIELGRIVIASTAAIVEVRGKVLRLVAALTNDELQAGRLASAISQALRAAPQSPRSELRIAIDTATGAKALVFSLVTGSAIEAPEGLRPFFSEVRRGLIEGGRHELSFRAAVQRRGALADTELRRLRDLVGRKSRDALMSELQDRNRELQESFENLRRTTQAKQRMESELNIGRDIQMSMLPVDFETYADRREFSIHATLTPAREVGGDFYDFFLIDDDHFCFCVGDVSGKGVPAALFMAVSKTLIKSRATNDPSPASILTHVNEELDRHNESCMFVTIWLGILNVKTGDVVYSNAGHNPPYILRASGELERCAERHGPVVGGMPGLVYKESRLRLVPGELMLLYTDGVTEAMDPAGELYSEQRLVGLLRARSPRTVEDCVSTTVDDVWSFQADADQADDVTVLAVQFCGERPGEETHVLELTLANRLEEIERCNEAFNAFAQERGLSDRVRRSLNLVLDEFLNNVISYAFDDENEHEIRVRVELSPNRLSLTIEDDGKPFNPFGQSAPDTTLGIEEREIGGLGLHLVRNVMDDVTYVRKTNRNLSILGKNLAHEGGEA